MVECWLPYGKTEVHASIPIKNLLDYPLIQPDVSAEPEKDILESIHNPVESPRIRDLAGKGRKVAVSLDGDLPSSHVEFVAEAIIAELFEAQVPPEDIVFIASPGTAGSLRKDLLGQLKPLEKLKISLRQHAWDNDDVKEIVGSESGVQVSLNRDFVDADIRIVIGDVKPDLFTGYTGFASVVFPGLSSFDSISSSTRNLWNPDEAPTSREAGTLFHKSADVSRFLKTDFAVSIVSDPAGRLIRIFSGNPEASHRTAVTVAEKTFAVSMRKDAEVLLISSGGYPYDRTLSRASVGICNLADFWKPQDEIVLMAECSEGLGDPMFYSSIRESLDMKKLERNLKERWSVGGELAWRLRKCTERRRVTLVSILPDYLVRSLNVKIGRTANDALNSATKGFAGATKILVLPSASSILPVFKA